MHFEAVRAIETAGLADGRHPLGRVWQVVVSGEVDWSREALMACLEGSVVDGSRKAGASLPSADSAIRFARRSGCDS
jgi:hypothetical protein